MVKSTKIKARTVRAGNKSNISTRKTLTKLNNKAILETATTTPSNKELKRNNLVRVRNCIVRIKRLKLNARDPTTYDVNKTLTAAQSKDGNKENRDDAHAGSYSLQSGKQINAHYSHNLDTPTLLLQVVCRVWGRSPRMLTGETLN